MNFEELFNQGISQMRQRNNNAAIQSFSQCIAQYGNAESVPVNIYFCLAQACENSGKKDDAVTAYKMFTDKAADIPKAVNLVEIANQKVLVIQQKVGRSGKDHFYFDTANGLIWDQEPNWSDPYHMLKLPIKLLSEVEKAIAESCTVPGMGQIWQLDFRNRMLASNLRTLGQR
jgi:hypothetical protein